MRIPPDIAHEVMFSTRAALRENGSLPHWPVRPREDSQATAPSNIARTAGTSPRYP
ncbi:hypothetical protein [Streptosporangium vulgare]|uniref:hypothetical protein n=1 Tax=Streptosporangium vulgare TaxID=46190 RepID=UPI0031E175A2